jgi:hypothetical protein
MRSRTQHRMGAQRSARRHGSAPSHVDDPHSPSPRRNRSCLSSRPPPPEGEEPSKSAVTWEDKTAMEAGVSRERASSGEWSVVGSARKTGIVRPSTISTSETPGRGAPRSACRCATAPHQAVSRIDSVIVLPIRTMRSKNRTRLRRFFPRNDFGGVREMRHPVPTRPDPSRPWHQPVVKVPSMLLPAVEAVFPTTKVFFSVVRAPVAM